MPYTISWFVPERIIYIQATGVFTTPEIMEMNKEYFQLVDAGKKPIHALVNASQLDKIDFKIKDIPSLLMPHDERFGWTLIVTTNRFFSFVSNISTHVTGSQYKTVDTLQDALDVLPRLDSSLPQDLTVFVSSNAV